MKGRADMLADTYDVQGVRERKEARTPPRLLGSILQKPSMERSFTQIRKTPVGPRWEEERVLESSFRHVKFEMPI